MVFGSGNKFRIRRSTSRASYLASYRRDRDRGLPNFEGSYKRTMSPSGQEGLDTPTTPAPECDRVPTLDSTSVPVEEKSEHRSASHTCTEIQDSPSVVPRTIEEVALESVTDPPRNSDQKSDKCAPEVIETETQCDLSEPPVQRVESHSSPKTPPEVPSTPPPKSPTPPSRVSPKVTESLQLMQRSEVVLRVNAATSDAASQTETETEPEAVVEGQQPEVAVVPPVLVRQKLQEEIECERLSLDLASQLPPSDKLQGILVPDPEHKKPTDYVSGLFRLDVALRPRPPSAAAFRTQTANSTTGNSSTLPTPSANGHAVPEDMPKENANTPVSPLPASSKYFTISESKAKFLTRYVRDMSQLNGLHDNKDLQQKKEELMARLDRKLEVLRGEHLVVTEESRVNDELGESVAAQVSRLARPHEAAKYRLHVEEVGKITSLLLGLSGRLARAENALMGLPHHHSERKILESKRDKLKEQLEEAKKLKENIDRRSVSVSNILYKYFNSEEYADYDHFINMKAKLIMDTREIADKIKLGEEQLAALKETLCTSD